MIEYAVTDAVLLAGQPEPEDWQPLAERGYGFVINLRSDAERATVEEANATAAGLRYRHLPLPAYELEPEHLVAFQQALADVGSDKLVLHCRSASRVALLWLLHRVENEGRDRAAAEAELRAAGYDETEMETFTFCADDYTERVTTS